MNIRFFERWFGGNLIAEQMTGVSRLVTVVFAATLVLVVGAVGFGVYKDATLDAISGYTGTLQTMETDVLRLRRHEKDFFERKTQEELDKHAAAFVAMRARMERLANEKALTPSEHESFLEFQKQVETYEGWFKKAADAQVAITAKGAVEGDDSSETADEAVAGHLVQARAAARKAEAILPGLRTSVTERGAATIRALQISRTIFAVIGLSILIGSAIVLVRTLGKLKTTAGSIQDGVAVLQSTVDRVRAGEQLKEGDGVQTDDEIGAVWRTVNGLLNERLVAQRKAEAENDQMNNSVISILEAVNQLSQRDLTARAPVTQDVIGTVSDSVNALADETSKVLREVTRIASSVAQASGKVKGQADLVSITAEDERKSVGEVILSLSQATETMGQMATLAEQSNRSAERATQATDNALATVNGTVKGMESIRETISETEKRIKRLGERSQEITGIVNLINTISERTHVLALNASMQAAVAGEAGRGFAVVAEEVQRLAESSRNATQQIGTLVGNIQLETNETIATVNKTIGQVVTGSEQAQKAGEQMRVTQEITGELVAQVQRIAAASVTQKAASEHLLKSVESIGHSTERTAQQIQTQNHETETLMESARRLVESVNVFKLQAA
jgi:methyl-accepting chemotaxis protein